MLSSLYSSTDNQGQTGTHINHQILYFSTSNIPARMYKKYPTVNTLYIFMFQEVLLGRCVNRQKSLVQETLVVSGRHIN